MNNSHTIKLPFWETVVRSFSFTFTNIGTIFKISISWFAVLALGLFAGYYYCTSGFDTSSGVNVQKLSLFLVIFSLLLSFVMLVVQAAFVRRTILRQDFAPFYFALSYKELKYVLYTLLIVMIVAAPVILVSELLTFIDMGAYTSYILLVILLISAVIGSRFLLALPAIAVENKQIGIFKSWDMTKGNANRIFWSLIFLAVPGYVCFMLLGSINMALGPISETVVMKLIFLALIFSVSFLDVCLKASFYGHIYQYFVYFSKPKTTTLIVEEELAVAEKIPTAKTSTPAKKTVAKKAPIKKSEPKPVAKKAPAKKTTVKKVEPKPVAKKTPAKKTATKTAPAKPTAKKSIAKKNETKKAPVKKVPAKKK